MSDHEGLLARGDTIPKLLLEHARNRPNKTAIREKDLGIWQSWNWREASEQVRAFACALANHGLTRGDKVAIIGDNRPHLYWAMTACQAVGAVPVPVYQDLGADEVRHVFDHAQVRFAIVEDQEQVDKVLAVVGGGDSAVEEASYLTKFASKVHMIHRRDQLRASKIMVTRAMDNPKIEILWNKVVSDVLGEDKITGVRLKDTKSGEESTLDLGGLFMAIGHTPATDFLEGQLELTSKKYIVLTTPFRTNTSVPGVFASGDVADDYYRQAVTSAGAGCMAALDAERWLAARE